MWWKEENVCFQEVDVLKYINETEPVEVENMEELQNALWNTQDSRQFAWITGSYKLDGNTSRSMVSWHMRDQIIKKAGTLPTGNW